MSLQINREEIKMRKIEIVTILLSVVLSLLFSTSHCTAQSISGIAVGPEGNVGIGTDTPMVPLHIRTDAETLPEMITGGIGFENTLHSLNSLFYLAKMDYGYVGLEVNNNFVMAWAEYGDAHLAGTLYESSDISLKEDITPMNMSLQKIARLQGVEYNWKDKKRGDKRQIGLIAQDVEKEFPEVVSTDHEGKKAIAYQKLVVPLIESVKALKAENESLTLKLAELEKRIARLEN